MSMRIRIRVVSMLILSALLLVILSTFSVGCKEKGKNSNEIHERNKDIEEIYVLNIYMDRYYLNKIDLINKEFSKADLANDTHKEQEYTFVCDLDDKRISDFILAVDDYKLLSWEEEYLPAGIIHDGHRWAIWIYFSDSTQQSMYGHNRYPETWNEMYLAFEELTGYVVLGAWVK